MDKRYQKTSQQSYNTTAQSYVATGTTLNILGVQCTDCGCSVTTQTAGMKINDSGLYYISADVTSTPTAAGLQTIQLYNGTSPLPCAITSDTTVSAATITQHAETTIRIPACCALNPVISVKISGVAGSVSFVKMTVTRQA